MFLLSISCIVQIKLYVLVYTHRDINSLSKSLPSLVMPGGDRVLDSITVFIYMEEENSRTLNINLNCSLIISYVCSLAYDVCAYAAIQRYIKFLICMH